MVCSRLGPCFQWPVKPLLELGSKRQVIEEAVMGKEPWLWFCCVTLVSIPTQYVAGFTGVSYWCEAALQLLVMHGASH